MRSSTLNGFFRRIFFNCAKSDHTFLLTFKFALGTLSSLSLHNKKWGSPYLIRRKRPFISLNNSVFIENLPSSESARAGACANHAKNDAQKGCAMQLNGITLSALPQSTGSSGTTGSSRDSRGRGQGGAQEVRDPHERGR